MTEKQKKEKAVVVTNKMFSLENEVFKKACEGAGTPATTRQASKYRLGKGLAYQNRNR